jgi:predicted Fe-Mo cluster-binding NifX family protein
MKICITAKTNSFEAQIDPRFGRCAYLLIVDLETMQFEAVINDSQNSTGGAGIQAAQILANKGVKVLLTGNVGPNAFQALTAADIEVIAGVSGSVKEAIQQYKQGKLAKTAAPTVEEHYAK